MIMLLIVFFIDYSESGLERSEMVDFFFGWEERKSLMVVMHHKRHMKTKHICFFGLICGGPSLPLFYVNLYFMLTSLPLSILLVKIRNCGSHSIL